MPLSTFSPSARTSALDARLEALIASAPTAISASSGPRRAGRIAVALGGVLVVAAGIGLGWAIGRATHGDRSTPPVSVPTTVGGPLGSVSVPASIQPSNGAPTTVAEARPSPTVAPTVATGATAGAPVAVLDGGWLTLDGRFADQGRLDAAIALLSPLGTNGVVVRAVVDPDAPSTTEIPVLVPAAALFEVGSAWLVEGQPLLDLFAEAMIADAAARLTIEGHTDDRGSESYNFALSQQRVASVFAYLTAKGVDSDRLRLSPRGETEPVADNSTVDGRARNRRVELIFST